MNKKTIWQNINSFWKAIVVISVILGLIASILQIGGAVDFMNPLYSFLTTHIPSFIFRRLNIWICWKMLTQSCKVAKLLEKKACKSDVIWVFSVRPPMDINPPLHLKSQSCRPPSKLEARSWIKAPKGLVRCRRIRVAAYSWRSRWYRCSSGPGSRILRYRDPHPRT